MTAVCISLAGCGDPRSELERIQDKGEIRIAIHRGPATYYEDKDGGNGLEYEMARGFAERLGVELVLVAARNRAEARRLLAAGRADIAAGGTRRKGETEPALLYGPGYQWITRQIVYRSSYGRPRTLEDISPDKLHIARGTLPEDVLEDLRESVPSLSWVTHDNRDNVDLVAMVENGEILYTVAYSNELLLARSSYPEIRAAFNITGPEPLAWALGQSKDRSLLKAVREYHEEIADNGRLADLIERFYGPTGFFDYVDSRKFIDKYRKSLPGLKAYFRRSAAENGIDWRLLAALSYQESHWNRRAKSYTGVRGLMMLTQRTAKQLGVKNRLDPEQSIAGGARYLKSLIERVPDRIREPDRTWMALAAYNVGFGHLEDARVLTEKDGGDPDLWNDVKLRLPLLSQRRWYRQTKHGYARGHEPVKFVRKIRKYYNVLVNLTQEERTAPPRAAESVTISVPAL